MTDLLLLKSGYILSSLILWTASMLPGLHSAAVNCWGLINCGPKERLSSKTPAAAEPAVRAEVGAAEAAPHFEADWVFALPRASESWDSWAQASPEEPKPRARSAFGAACGAAEEEALQSAGTDAVPRHT